MHSLWNDGEAAEFEDELGLRVYSSRLLGKNDELALYGGGNTSVKITRRNIVGEEEELLYVKGSGWDLASIEPEGFAPVKMAHLLKLAKLNSLSDPNMVNELKTNMADAGAPAPSVETVLHAVLPYKYVDHTHADAVVTVTNSSNGFERIREIYDGRVVIVPYVMPGFELARICAREFNAQAHDNTIGMVLMNHGIFSFGKSARESYERMVELVTRAEEYLKANNAWELKIHKFPPPENIALQLAELRKNISQVAGKAMIIHNVSSERAMSFVNREDMKKIATQGPATPDHVIRTKRIPMTGFDLSEYKKNYERYFAGHASGAKEAKTMLDPAPRVILDGKTGMCCVGGSIKDARIVRDIYLHTMDIIERATLLGGYKALPPQDIFAVEYWDLEQAKLKKSGVSPLFGGEVALVTGAASGIGKACVDSFLSRGAAVAGLDINPAITSLHERDDFLGLVGDIRNESTLKQALEDVVTSYGGIDMLVLNAGIFPPGMLIAAMDMDWWQTAIDINLTASLKLMKLAAPFLKLAPNGGRVVVIGSKNVAAPGPGAAAYSASKAALNQLVRVAALEWGKDNIRVNELHPDSVFDTGIWTKEVLESRAESYGIRVEDYKTRNVMKVEVTSFDVAELAAAMCGPLFAKTTAAQIPVDGGNDRVI